MIRFDISVSPNFKGFREYNFFELDDKAELINILKSHWNNTGLTHETGEAYLKVTFSYNGRIITLPLGTFVFYKNGDFFIQLDFDDDRIAAQWEAIDYVEESVLFEDQHFPCLLYTSDAADE